jgi:MSHA biogenesis protein MshO
MAKRAAGFTLVELIVVIVITSIIAAVVAVFIRAPVEGYFDAARRAELTDTADTALRRMARDLRLALPNSVRLSGSAVEFLQTRTGGRYRVESDGGTTPADELDFTANDTSFDFLGTLSSTPVAGDLVVVYNLGITDANAYAGDNSSAVTGVAGSTISINSKQFPFESPGNRFQVVTDAVSYVCAGAGIVNGDGTGTLRRYWGYGIAPAQTVPPGGSNALLANNVSSCSFVYTQGVTARSGLVTMRLQITEDGESVSLYHEVHVPNVP